MTRPNDNLLSQLRDIGQHLLELSGNEPKDEQSPRAAMPLSPFPHRPELIDDRAYLCQLAREEYHERQRRKHFLEDMFLGEPAWNMLLDLFVNSALQRRVAVSSICYAAEAPITTALRYIELMAEKGLVERFPDQTDKRRTWIQLTPGTYDAMARYLADRGEGRRSVDGRLVSSQREKL
jgi:predicted transcriptional regulator